MTAGFKRVYWRFIYRHHMRLIHPRWHWWTHLQPINGRAHDWCQWCGARRWKDRC